MENSKIFYRRHLPHYQPSGCTYFITFRLAGSLPRSVILDLKTEYEFSLKKVAEIKNKNKKYSEYEEMKLNYFEKFDSFFYKFQNEVDWLNNPEIASIAKDAIHYRDKKEYNLIAYTIMPNHVHIIFTLIKNNFVGQADLPDQSKKDETADEQTRSPYIVTNILKSLKWHTAVESNKILQHTGPFWQHESYDHVIRNEEELIRIIEYTLLNPVKAGLVKKWEDWKWSYSNFKDL